MAFPQSVGQIFDKGNNIDGITFDILSARRVNQTQQITDNPIEDGSSISDFSIQEPITINLTVEIGNVSLFDINQEPGENARRAFEELERLYENRSFVSYQTGFRLYENMLLTSINLTDDIRKPNALIAEISLKQVIITESEQVAIPSQIVQSGKARQQLSSTINAGRIEPIPIHTEDVLNEAGDIIDQEVTASLIPMIPDPSRRLETSLNNERFFLQQTFNPNSQSWSFDLEDSSSKIFAGIPLITGTNILNPLRRLGSRIGQLWLSDLTGKYADPTIENLGNTMRLLHIIPGKLPNTQAILAGQLDKIFDVSD